jgi:hypothetical protein
MSMASGGERPTLFQVREPPRRFVVPLLGVVALHFVLVAWTMNRAGATVRPPVEVKVVFRQLPPPKTPVHESPGGSPRPKSARRHRIHRRVETPKLIPPPPRIQEAPPGELEPEPLAEAEEAGDDEGDDQGVEGGTRRGTSGTGTGIGTGSGTGSRARKAWLTHTDWRCPHPGHYELGYTVVRIRVEVLLDGRPGRVTVVRPGPEEFNQRAIECARAETYLPALDPDGNPIPGEAEFGIEFRS